MPPSEGASRREHRAYNAIEPDDEAHMSRLLRQPVKGHADMFGSVQAPYAKASAMLEKAQSIGNITSRASAAAFFRSWRTQGTPFAQENSAAHRPEATSASRNPKRSSARLAPLRPPWCRHGACAIATSRRCTSYTSDTAGLQHSLARCIQRRCHRSASRTAASRPLQRTGTVEARSAQRS